MDEKMRYAFKNDYERITLLGGHYATSAEAEDYWEAGYEYALASLPRISEEEIVRILEIIPIDIGRREHDGVFGLRNSRDFARALIQRGLVNVAKKEG